MSDDGKLRVTMTRVEVDWTRLGVYGSVATALDGCSREVSFVYDPDQLIDQRSVRGVPVLSGLIVLDTASAVLSLVETDAPLHRLGRPEELDNLRACWL